MWKKKLADAATVEWAPTNDAYKICAFVPEKNGQAGSFRIYSVPSNQRLGMQTCYKAQSGSILWNKQGTHALLVTQTDMDTTGKSYYGETGVFLMNINNESKNIRPFLDKDGPIYSYAWSPLGESFVIVFGNMPSTTVLFNTKLERLISFPTSHRNTVLFSPHGHTLAIAGFGNLQGTIVSAIFFNLIFFSSFDFCHFSKNTLWKVRSMAIFPKFVSLSHECIFSIFPYLHFPMNEFPSSPTKGSGHSNFFGFDLLSPFDINFYNVIG